MVMIVCTFLVDLVRDTDYSPIFSILTQLSPAVLQSYRDPRHWALFPLPSAFDHPSFFIHADVVFLTYFLSTVGTVGTAAVISGMIVTVVTAAGLGPL